MTEHVAAAEGHDMLAARHEDAPPITKSKNGAGGKKNTLKRLMSRATSDETGKPTTLRRRRMRFLMDYQLCDPGGFESDFYILLESPSTEIELAAMKVAGNNGPAALAMEMARRCIVSIDGEPVRDDDLSRDVVWEALGNKGRALLTNQWNELSGGGLEAETNALKKAQGSTQLVLE